MKLVELFSQMNFFHFLSTGTVAVHCVFGISRSASLVMSYLMIYRNLSVLEAFKCIRNSRQSYPNDGFMRELCELDHMLFVDQDHVVWIEHHIVASFLENHKETIFVISLWMNDSKPTNQYREGLLLWQYWYSHLFMTHI